MLSNQNFYFQLHNKYIELFGSLFNNINIIRYNRDTSAELSRFKAPIVYGPKEHWLERLRGDPNLNKEIAIALPRMSFVITGINYDNARKRNPVNKFVRANTSSQLASQYDSIPYDIQFRLSIYARNLDDGYQIIEQIIPFFTPDYTFTANLIPEMGIKLDIPVTLNDVNDDIEYEGAESNNVRTAIWDLDFTMKAFFYGPISPTGIIRTVITNIYNDPSFKEDYVMLMNLITGIGDFKIDDYVYQGPSMNYATALGKVVKWNNHNLTLSIGDLQGRFQVNNNVYAVSTNAVYKISSFDASPKKLSEITITPDPSTAQPGDQWSANTVIVEYPETLP